MLTDSPIRVKTTDMTAAWRHVDYWIIGLTLALSGFGLLLVYSATSQKGVDQPGLFVTKHATYMLIGAVAFAGAAALDYRWLFRRAPIVYGVTVAGLLGVLVVGAEVNGTTGWFVLGSVQIQPAEFAKLGVILTLAGLLARDQGDVTVRRLMVGLGVVGLPVVLILAQPDLGSALVFLVIGAVMLTVAGVPARHLGALAVLAVLGVVGILNSNQLKEYQVKRLTSFVEKSCPTSRQECYNVNQAQIAISSGGITGYGYRQGPQTRGQFVPAQQTDFIFTVVGEEFGFVGSTLLLGLMAALVYRVWRTSLESRDLQGTLLCAGVLAYLVFHTFENVGMTMGIMPVTGIPLPLVSYGGSSVLTTYVALGLVLNVRMRQYSLDDPRRSGRFL